MSLIFINLIIFKKKIDVALNKSAATAMDNDMLNQLFDKTFQTIDFNGLTIRQLTKIIMYNKKPDGGSIVFDYIKMPKSQLVTEMNYYFLLTYIINL